MWEHFDNIQTDIVVIGESWLTDEDTHWINKSELNKDGWRFLSAPWIYHTGKGLALCLDGILFALTITRMKNLIICGDFNIHYEEADNPGVVI